MILLFSGKIMHNGPYPYEERWLRALAALRAPEPDAGQIDDLRGLLNDPMRGSGEQVRVWLEQGKAAGVVGWVAANVPRNGELYGGPLLAANRPALDGLIETLLQEAAVAGARFVHVSAADTEQGKHAALLAHGFQPHFHFLTLSAPSAAVLPRPLPEGWQRVETTAVDWTRLAALFARCFAEVPHVPYHSPEKLREDWLSADGAASQVWAAPDGSYRAFLLACTAGQVEAVGVDPRDAGQGIAAAMYAVAAIALQSRGVEAMEALVADCNAGSLALHRKLDFVETCRRQVYRHTLAVPI
ncbi:hypothetical protein BUE93_01395 [Chromobacterium amazonense]|uniref:N-acetyltransferase domain-containing protein n=2 Tax=Chromobacterium amazonense TaxID=1382803 RepID=A0A2S9XAF9_9NEIS|nr:hypothetical protein BUE93_01395 [Chromobacterium amazonense]